VIAIVEFDSAVDQLLESFKPLTSQSELIGDATRKAFSKMKGEGGIVPIHTRLKSAKLGDIGRSLAVVLHGKGVQLEFSISNFIGVTEQGEQLLLEAVPVVKETSGIGIIEQVQIWFKPLSRSATQVRGSVKDLLATFGESAGIIQEKNFARLEETTQSRRVFTVEFVGRFHSRSAKLGTATARLSDRLEESKKKL